MTSITDATGYTDQDSGHSDHANQTLTNAPKPGASYISGPLDPYTYPACPHCSEGREFSPCRCPA